MLGIDIVVVSGCIVIVVNRVIVMILFGSLVIGLIFGKIKWIVIFFFKF